MTTFAACAACTSLALAACSGASSNDHLFTRSGLPPNDTDAATLATHDEQLARTNAASLFAAHGHLSSDIAAPSMSHDLPLPGPAPRAPLQPLDGIGMPVESRCVACHEEIATEWQGSLHRRSWLNDYFPRSYALEPVAFCRKCHAPSADPSTEPSLEAREIGVGCTSCHVVPAGIVGVHAQAARADAHAVLGDARLATPEACGNCHAFAFPAPSGIATGPMQDTISEHQRSTAGAKTCQNCHMPDVPSRSGGTHKSHAFRVQGDRNMLASAVVVKSAQLLKGEVRLDIAPGEIGHAFPTGDLYRQVEVRVDPIDTAGHVLTTGSAETLGRTFGATRVGRDALVRVQRSDTRLAAPRTMALQVPKTTRRARWQIVWQRLPPWLATRLGMVMRDHELVVVEGVVTR